MASSTAASTWECEPRYLEIPVLLWIRLLADLRKRGEGRRESGAFLLGTQGRGRLKARSFVPYDHLDPRAFESGVVRMGSLGFAKLWQVCRERGLRVVADVHTHPGGMVEQSGSDRDNPMVEEGGHLALIVPSFSSAVWIGLGSVGKFEYLGRKRWRPAVSDRVRLRLF